MTAESPLPQDSPQPRRRWQFSLRGLVICVFVLSIVFAFASQFPRQSLFALYMTLLLLIPLVIVALIRAVFARLGIIADDRLRSAASAQHGPIARALVRPLCWLGLWQSKAAPSLLASLATAIISTITLIGLWPLLREIGLTLALFAWQPMAVNYTWANAGSSMSEAFSSGGYWQRLWQWEAWSVGRWWLLFGIVLLVWLAVSTPLRRWFRTESVASAVARFLDFAPWIIVLELAFLIGVWIESPNTVPEPSTGFVVGIFSWDLWHWDCWLNRGWLIRGAFPTLVAGAVFFAGVLRWRWPVAVVAALVLIPIAILLSIASTVAY